MAVKTRPRANTSSKAGQDEATCPVCGDGITAGLSHCEGSKAAYGCQVVFELVRSGNSLQKFVLEHHHGHKWEPCWKCEADMGCSLCVPGKRDQYGNWFCDELVCKPCRVKANPESFLNGGPLSPFTVDIGQREIVWGLIRKHTPDVSEYPFEWRAKYAAQRSRLGLPIDLPADHGEVKVFRMQVEAIFTETAMPQAKAKRRLQGERNRQVAALAGWTGG